MIRHPSLLLSTANTVVLLTMPASDIFDEETHYTLWPWLQANAKGEATAGSNAIAKARAWIENRGSWASALAAAGVALVGTAVLKRAAGAVPGIVMGHHHAGALTS